VVPSPPPTHEASTIKKSSSSKSKSLSSKSADLASRSKQADRSVSWNTDIDLHAPMTAHRRKATASSATRNRHTVSRAASDDSAEGEDEDTSDGAEGTETKSDQIVSFDDLVSSNGNVFKDVLKLARSSAFADSRALQMNPRFRSLGDRDWRGLVGIRAGSVEYGFGERFNAMSETLISVIKILGPSREGIALLGVHEELQTMALAMGAPYKDRAGFLQKHSESMEAFDQKSLKDLLVAQTKSHSSSYPSTSKSRSTSFSSLGRQNYRNNNNNNNNNNSNFNNRRWQPNNRRQQGFSSGGFSPQAGSPTTNL
jgi:hypothetical protein